MILKKNDKVVVPECLCADCAGDADSASNCVSEAIGQVHIVKKVKRDGELFTKCGLLARQDEVVVQKKTVKNVCEDCAHGHVVWHQPNTAGSRHEELVSGIDSLHQLVFSMVSFMTAHFHANSSEDECPVCVEAKKQFHEHQKDCPHCHE